MSYHCFFRARFEQPTMERMNEPGWMLGCWIEQVAETQSSRFLFREATTDYNIDPSNLYKTPAGFMLVILIETVARTS